LVTLPLSKFARTPRRENEETLLVGPGGTTKLGQNSMMNNLSMINIGMSTLFLSVKVVSELGGGSYVLLISWL
jgi:hypothetical protein